MKIQIAGAVMATLASLAGVWQAQGSSEDDAVAALLDASRRVPSSGRGMFLYSLEYHAVQIDPLAKTLSGLGFDVNEKLRAKVEEMLSTLYDISLANSPKSNEYRLDNIVFRGEQFVWRRADLTRDEYVSIKTDPYAISNMNIQYRTYAYDGSKTTRIEGKEFHQQLFWFVLIDGERIDVPDMGSFGMDASFNEIVTLSDWKNGIVSTIMSNDTVSIELVDKTSPIPFGDMRRRAKWVANAARGYMLDRVEVGFLDAVMREAEYQNYFRTSSGRWYPGLSVMRDYAPVDQVPVLVKEERYEVVSQLVELDVEVSDQELNPVLPRGASGTDFAVEPPRDFYVESDGSMVYR